MAMAAGEIEEILRAGLPDAEVTVSDLRGDGRHFAVHVVSPSFRDLGRVDQQRLVHDLLEPRLGDGLQALAIQTAAPD